jgi:hypothetical protein
MYHVCTLTKILYVNVDCLFHNTRMSLFQIVLLYIYKTSSNIEFTLAHYARCKS